MDKREQNIKKIKATIEQLIDLSERYKEDATLYDAYLSQIDYFKRELAKLETAYYGEK